MLWNVNHCMCRTCFSQYQASSAVGVGTTISCQDGDHYQLSGWGPLSAVGMGTIISCWDGDHYLVHKTQTADRWLTDTVFSL